MLKGHNCLAAGAYSTKFFACRRLVPRLRALVVLPTRDLAAQVFRVFQTLAPAVGLRVGLAAAAAPVAAEAAALMTGLPGSGFEAGSVAASAPALLSGPSECGWHARLAAGPGLGPGSGHSGCAVDVLVATPGRLMAHLRGTPGVSLEHLRFLVRPITLTLCMAQMMRCCLHNAKAGVDQ